MAEAFDFYNAIDDGRYGRVEMPDEEHFLRSTLETYGPRNKDANIVEIGCGKGALSEIHPGYVGIDLSHRALKSQVKTNRAIQGDAENLPLKDDSVDFLFSFATLEHVPNPHRAIGEIERVMKPNGVALIHPAWFCRKWAAKALPIRAYSQLSLGDKLEKLLLPLTELLPVRLAKAMPRRVFREARFIFSSKPSEFDYVRLNPNLKEYVYTDSDAWTHMDSHSCLMYFHSRGWELLSAPTFVRRLSVRHEPVVVRKKASGGLST
jgi:SAM-dependent methyltransferase